MRQIAKIVILLSMLLVGILFFANEIFAITIYESYDGVSSANFTYNGQVSAAAAYNTTNGFVCPINSYSAEFSYPKYANIPFNTSSIYMFTQVAFVKSMSGDGQYYGYQGIRFYNANSNITVYILPDTNPAITTKTTWSLSWGVKGSERNILATVSGCSPINIVSGAWVGERIIVTKIDASTTQFSFNIYNITTGLDLCNTTSVNVTDPFIYNANAINWGSKDGHASGSTGYYFDEVRLTTDLESISFINVNCTSTGSNGDTQSPYTTDDTTPTFSFGTVNPSNCRIANENMSYLAMGDSRNCTEGQGAASHRCTLTSQDELVSVTDYVYISCIPTYTGSEITKALLMEITSLDANSTRAIENGVKTSSIWPGATLYTNQKVYLRSLNNSQKTATVDMVAVYGNQRWIINYANETENNPGLFNITPVVYVLEMKNISLTEIQTRVSAYINSTKN